jgi:hypothetical protein
MSARYLPALAVLLVLALVPTVIHGYLGATVADGRSAAAIPLRLASVEGRPTDRPASVVFDTFAANDFVERQYGPDLLLFVARAYDAKRLYHHPELAVAYGDAYERARIVRRPDRPDVPVHLLEGRQGRLSVYALHYQDEFIADPIRFQLRNALTLLGRPRSLTTLFFVRARGSTDADVRSPAEDLLHAAIDAFLSQPGTSPP